MSAYQNAELVLESGARKYGFSINGARTWDAYRISDSMPIGEIRQRFGIDGPLFAAYINDRWCRYFSTLDLAFRYLCARAEIADLESLAR